MGMAKREMSVLNKIWKESNIAGTTKIKVVQTLAFSLFLYGVGTWALKAADCKRFDDIGMRC